MLPVGLCLLFAGTAAALADGASPTSAGAKSRQSVADGSQVQVRPKRNPDWKPIWDNQGSYDVRRTARRFVSCTLVRAPPPSHGAAVACAAAGRDVRGHSFLVAEGQEDVPDGVHLPRAVRSQRLGVRTNYNNPHHNSAADVQLEENSGSSEF